MDPEQISSKETQDLDFEISFFEKILKENPNYVDALIPMGDAYTKRGLIEKGLKVDLKLSELMPEDPLVFYNLACSYSLLKNTDKAMDALKKSLKLGYNDIDYLMEDPDLKNLREDKSFMELVRQHR